MRACSLSSLLRRRCPGGFGRQITLGPDDKQVFDDPPASMPSPLAQAPFEITPRPGALGESANRALRLDSQHELELAKLVGVTEAALYKGIEKAVAGNRVSDVSHAVQEYAESFGYSVVRDFVGHGIGRRLHEDPQVPNFGPPGQGPRLKTGTTLAIEPMINMGVYQTVVLDDGWTAVTRDRSLSAQFEHTVGVTEKGVEVFTFSPAGLDKPPYKR